MPELNWCGQPIRDGEGYGGRPEHIPKTWGKKTALATAKHYEVVKAEHLAAVFSNGPISRAEAAKRLQARTGVHRTSCYRALRPSSRFAGHLRLTEQGMLSWQSL
jgi:hypothetical protein